MACDPPNPLSQKFQSVDPSSLPTLDTITLMEVHAAVPIEKQNLVEVY